MTDLASLGFELVQERRDGTRQYSRREHPYLAFWLSVAPDGAAQLSWELALGEYLVAKGLAVSAQDELSLFVFPKGEAHGTLDEDGWLTGEIERVQRRLGSIDLRRGT